jgi:hypothetical protein
MEDSFRVSSPLRMTSPLKRASPFKRSYAQAAPQPKTSKPAADPVSRMPGTDKIPRRTVEAIRI